MQILHDFIHFSLKKILWWLCFIRQKYWLWVWKRRMYKNTSFGSSKYLLLSYRTIIGSGTRIVTKLNIRFARKNRWLEMLGGQKQKKEEIVFEEAVKDSENSRQRTWEGRVWPWKWWKVWGYYRMDEHVRLRQFLLLRCPRCDRLNDRGPKQM